MSSAVNCTLSVTSPPFFKTAFLVVVALTIPAFFLVMWVMSRSQNKTKSEAKRKHIESKLNRAEALRNLESFTRELEASWQRDGLDWAPELLGILTRFNREASRGTPDRAQLDLLRNELRGFIANRKFLKGIANVLEYADAVCQPESE
jgi:hypothetical protein